MKEFRFLSFHTVYSCTGDLARGLESDACFGYVFNRIREKMKVNYDIILYRGTERAAKDHLSNACLLPLEVVRNHVDKLNRLYPVKYSVEEVNDFALGRNKRMNVFIVHLELKEVPPTFHKYCLTWVRYLYEYPYNVLIRDAYMLKQDPIFRFESIANIFNLCLGCFNDYGNDIHQIPLNVLPESLKISEVRDKIAKVKSLNNIYNTLKRKGPVIPEMINNFSNTDIEYWDQGFDDRRKVYLEVYLNLYKNNKK